MDREKQKEVRRSRRNELQRKRRRARKIFSSWSWWGLDTKENREWIDHMVCTHANNMQACSCSMCTSPRRSLYSKGKYKLTRQEQKFLDSMKDQIGSVS